eukprot:63070-Heterocapsa_arctica.AAC.1
MLRSLQQPGSCLPWRRPGANGAARGRASGGRIALRMKLHRVPFCTKPICTKLVWRTGLSHTLATMAI